MHEMRTSRNVFKDSINGLKHFEAGVLNFKHYQNVLIETSRSNISNKVIEKNMLAIIDHHSVDTYPWKIAYIPTNNLNWQSRPVFQSYVGYTPWLDKKNEFFFSSSKSPQFIVWDIEN